MSFYLIINKTILRKFKSKYVCVLLAKGNVVYRKDFSTIVCLQLIAVRWAMYLIYVCRLFLYATNDVIKVQLFLIRDWNMNDSFTCQKVEIINLHIKFHCTYIALEISMIPRHIKNYQLILVVFVYPDIPLQDMGTKSWYYFIAISSWHICKLSAVCAEILNYVYE